MSHLTDKVSYIRGLMEGLGVDAGSNEGRLLKQIVELLGEMADEMEALSAVQDELSEYVDDIDNDLCELEHVVGLDDEDDDDDFDDDDEDDDEDDDDFEFDEDEECSGDCGACSGCAEEDDDNVYVECMCPSCQSTFYVLESELGENVFHICPRCNERIHVEPDFDEEIPVAELADEKTEE